VRKWDAAENVVGYRKTYSLTPGQMWVDAEVTEGQYEHLVDTDGGTVPVGVIIVRELLDDGADWAYATELWGPRPVLLNSEACCVAADGPVAELLRAMRDANAGRYGGLPDVTGVTGVTGDRIHLREAKVGWGRDRLNPNQHDFLRSQRQAFGGRVDPAVVEWDIR
jgi:hypothetical protein